VALGHKSPLRDGSEIFEFGDVWAAGEEALLAGDELLDLADGLRAKRRAALAQLDTLLQSTFLDLFGDPVTNPKGWETSILKNIARIQTGSTPSSKKEGMFDGSVPFVTPGDLTDSWIETKRTLTEEGARNSRTVQRGATLICCIGATIGKMGKATSFSGFNQQINSIEWKASKVDADFGLEITSVQLRGCYGFVSQ